MDQQQIRAALEEADAFIDAICPVLEKIILRVVVFACFLIEFWKVAVRMLH